MKETYKITNSKDNLPESIEYKTSKTPFNKNDLYELGNAIDAHPSIKKCFMSDNDFSENQFSELTLNPLKNITHLYISYCYIRDETAEYLSRLEKLVFLKINGNYLTNIGAKYLSKCTSIVSLNIASNDEINDQGVNYIASSLINLQNLNISNTKISDKSIKKLCKKNRLLILSCNGTRLSDKSVKYIFHRSKILFFYAEWVDFTSKIIEYTIHRGIFKIKLKNLILSKEQINLIMENIKKKVNEINPIDLANALSIINEQPITVPSLEKISFFKLTQNKNKLSDEKKIIAEKFISTFLNI